MPARMEHKEDRAKSAKEEAQVRPDAYLVSLGDLARELDARARGTADLATLRILRQRLSEWIEDLRSVGTHDALASAVEDIVHRLSAALAAGTSIAGTVAALAGELAALAAGAPVPAPTAPKPGSRLAFWK